MINILNAYPHPIFQPKIDFLNIEWNAICFILATFLLGFIYFKQKKERKLSRKVSIQNSFQEKSDVLMQYNSNSEMIYLSIYRGLIFKYKEKTKTKPQEITLFEHYNKTVLGFKIVFNIMAIILLITLICLVI